MKTKNYFLLPRGERNSIADIGDVEVGHVTIREGEHQTGVTVLLPHKENLFSKKLFAASHVMNGYGKSAGLSQMDELGYLETPIAFTNTASVGVIYDGLYQYMSQNNEGIGRELGSVNPIVLECNDGKINDQRNPILDSSHFQKALEDAKKDFLQGDVGAGRGMICYNYKGGIGSASRKVESHGISGTVGALVLTNFGDSKNLRVLGTPAPSFGSKYHSEDKGSIAVVIGTDLPLLPHQLKRVAKRAQSGIARTGSYMGHGSGDLAVAFSTAQTVLLEEKEIHPYEMVPDLIMDLIFLATVESVEEAILQSMFRSSSGKTLKGEFVPSLAHYITNPLD